MLTIVFVGEDSLKLRNTFSTFVPRTTRPNTVNPPFCVSRFAALFAKLKNHWELAELGSPPAFAMAIVPYTLLKNRPTANSLVMVPKVGIGARIALVVLRL